MAEQVYEYRLIFQTDRPLTIEELAQLRSDLDAQLESLEDGTIAEVTASLKRSVIRKET